MKKLKNIKELIRYRLASTFGFQVIKFIAHSKKTKKQQFDNTPICAKYTASIFQWMFLLKNIVLSSHEYLPSFTVWLCDG